MTSAAIDAVLAEFRTWLHEAAASAETLPVAAPEGAALDLATLLGQFIALRHEVNLQTKATRSQQELGGETLRQLSQAFETLKQTSAAASSGPTSQDEVLRPLLKTLVDLADSLSLGVREVQRVQEAVLPLLDQLATIDPPADEPDVSRLEEFIADLDERAEQPQPSFWSRWFARDKDALELLDSQRKVIAAQREIIAYQLQQLAFLNDLDPGPLPEEMQAADRARQLLVSIITGYTMSLQRVERALQQHGLEPMPTTGEIFDPERMEVVEVVADSDRPNGEVVGEVRRGYLWRGRVFRYAQVRVAKS